MAAAKVINDAKDLTNDEKTTIHNVKSISVDAKEASGDLERTEVHVSTGRENLRSTYIAGSDATWLASAIAHDAFHITQSQRGEGYTKDSAAKLKGMQMISNGRLAQSSDSRRLS